MSREASSSSVITQARRDGRNMIAAAGFVQSCFLCKAVLCALWCATSAAEQQRCELMNYTLRLQLRSACGDAEQLYGVSRAKWTRKKRVFHAFADAPSETAPRLRDVAAMSGVNFDALRNMDGFVEHLSQNHSEPARRRGHSRIRRAGSTLFV